jgi:hypothetical protein
MIVIQILILLLLILVYRYTWNIYTISMALEYHHNPCGDFFTTPAYNGSKEIHTTPYKKLDTNAPQFQWLKSRLRETPFKWKVFQDGSVFVEVPKGHKFGYILGWIAWTYTQLGSEPQ